MKREYDKNVKEGTSSASLVATGTEVIKNRVFGMPTTKMTRHQRVSFTSMIKIAFDTLKDKPDTKVFEHDTKEFMKMIGLSSAMQSNHLFSKTFIDEDDWEQEEDGYALEKTLRELITKEIVFRHKNPEGKTYQVEATALLSHFKLDRKTITFEFSEWIRTRILTTNNAYIMKIPIIASFKSGYTVTLFEQIEQRRDFSRWEVSITALRSIFGLEKNKYERFSNFRARVIEVAIAEINEKTSYTLNWEKIMDGKKVKKVVFTWRINKNSFIEFQEFMRKNFVDTPLVQLPGQDKTTHMVQISQEGKIYNANGNGMVYTTEKAQEVWKWMYENQSFLIPHQKKELGDKDYSGEDYSIYYGKDLLYDDDMFHNIIIITRSKGNGKLKVKFENGGMIIMSEDELKESVIFGNKK